MMCDTCLGKTQEGQNCEILNHESHIVEAKESVEGELIIYHAGSLSIPFQALEKEFNNIYPGINIKRTAGGSRDIARKIIDLGDKVDILCSADYTVIDDLLIPEYAEWNVLFAKNAMVIMYSEDSQFADEIRPDNWYDILLRDGVDFGHSEPNSDPCGYRSVLLWQLAESYYGIKGLDDALHNACKEKNITPKSAELMAMLDAGALDYVFEYESVAIQHTKKNPNTKYIKLPEEINLSSMKYKDIYSQSKIDLNGKKSDGYIRKKGQPIVYGLTMPKTGENEAAAVEFIKFLLDAEKGMKILQKKGQPILEKMMVIHSENLPNALKTSI